MSRLELRSDSAFAVCISPLLSNISTALNCSTGLMLMGLVTRSASELYGQGRHRGGKLRGCDGYAMLAREDLNGFCT